MARLDSRRRWSSMTANPPQMVSLRGKGAGSGVIHAPGVPGAPPLREISIDEVTCADGSISSAVRATRMGNTDSAPALDDLFQGAAAPAPPSRSGTTRKSVDGTALYVAAEPGPSGVRLRRSVISCRCFGLGSADGARSGYRRDRVP